MKRFSLGRVFGSWGKGTAPGFFSNEGGIQLKEVLAKPGGREGLASGEGKNAIEKTKKKKCRRTHPLVIEGNEALHPETFVGNEKFDLRKGLGETTTDGKGKGINAPNH